MDENQTEAETLATPPAPEAFAEQDDTKPFAGAVYESYSKMPAGMWLTSFTDLVALMLAFFVLMYSMSTPREDKWVEVTAALEDGLVDRQRYKGTQWNPGPEETIALQKLNYERALDMRYLAEILSDFIKADKRLEKVKMRRGKNQLVLVLPEEVFAPAQAGGFSEEGEVVVSALAEMLTRLSNRAEIIAAIDEAEARRDGLNPWQTALRRAVLIGGQLQAEGYEKSLSLHAAILPRGESPGETVIVITADTGTDAGRFTLDNDG